MYSSSQAERSLNLNSICTNLHLLKLVRISTQIKVNYIQHRRLKCRANSTFTKEKKKIILSTKTRAHYDWLDITGAAAVSTLTCVTITTHMIMTLRATPKVTTPPKGKYLRTSVCTVQPTYLVKMFLTHLFARLFCLFPAKAGLSLSIQAIRLTSLLLATACSLTI